MGKLSGRIPRPESWTAAFTGVLALAGASALWVAQSQLREFHEQAQVQHLLALTQQFGQEPMVTYRRRLAEQRLKNQEDPNERYPVLDFFETVGMLVNRGYLNERDVWETFGYWVFNLSADAQDIIEQQQRDDPNLYAEFTSLVKRLQSIEAEHKGKGARPTKEEITQFYREESSVGAGGPMRTHARVPKQPAKR